MLECRVELLKVVFLKPGVLPLVVCSLCFVVFHNFVHHWVQLCFRLVDDLGENGIHLVVDDVLLDVGKSFNYLIMDFFLLRVAFDFGLGLGSIACGVSVVAKV